MIRTYLVNSSSQEHQRAGQQLPPDFGNVSRGWAVFLNPEEFSSFDFHTNRLARLLLGRDLLRGEVGTALAHQAIYEDHLKQEDEWALVLEDDAKVLPSEFNKRIQAIIDSEVGEKHSTKPIVVLLGYHSNSVLLWPNKVLTRQLTIPTGTFGYLINKPASSTLRSDEKIDFVADWPPASKKIKFFALNAPIVKHASSELSLIDQARDSVSRKSADADASSVLERLRSVSSINDLLLAWHFIIKRGTAFRFIFPLLRRVFRRF